MGITLWELFEYGKTPYSTMTNGETVRRVTGGFRLAKPRDCSSDIYDTMLKCWSVDPEERPTFKEVYDVILNVLKRQSVVIGNENSNSTQTLPAQPNPGDIQYGTIQHIDEGPVYKGEEKSEDFYKGEVIKDGVYKGEERNEDFYRDMPAVQPEPTDEGTKKGGDEQHSSFYKDF